MGKKKALAIAPKKKERIARRVFLAEREWEELSTIGRLQAEAFHKLGTDRFISRNRVIAVLLRWGMDAYWQDVGGPPSSRAEWSKCVRGAVKRLSAELAKEGM